MSDTPNLDELRILSHPLAGLMADPQPGLHTWHLALNRVLMAIAEFVK